MMMNKVAIITGSTRGIGRHLALTLAKNGYNITVTGKSTKSTKNLPGSIYSVADEVCDLGSDALPIKLDVRNVNEIEHCVKETYETWGRIDVLINNAGALWWKSIKETPVNKYDLINDINSRASFLMARETIPYMLKNDGGHVINFSPPLTSLPINNYAPLKNKTAYLISKMGMTLGMLGISREYLEHNIASNSLWPLRPVESYALINNNLGDSRSWYKQDIISDSVMHILKEDKMTFTGNQLVDEEYLKHKGVTDFTKYRCHPDFEPPKLDEIHHLWDTGLGPAKV